MIDGIKVQIGPAEYVVPPISCWAAKKSAVAAARATKDGGGEDAWIDTLWEQIRLALFSNYPELDVEALQQAVAVRDLLDVHARVMAAAGAKRGDQGEAVSP